MNYARIIGTGSYLPERVVTNEYWSQQVDTSDEWIHSRTGIRQRHFAADGEYTSDLAEKAARRALEAAGVMAKDLDLIIVATTTPDQVFPSTACILQERLGNIGAPSFDVQAVCAGFVFAVSIANQFLRCEQARNVLVVGAETFSRIIDHTDRSTCVLFGDGSGAVVMTRDNAPGIVSTHLHSDGRYKDLLQVPCGVSKHYDHLTHGSAFTQMKGSDVYKLAVSSMSSAIQEALQHNGLDISDIDWLVPHQANTRIISAIGKRVGIAPEKVVVTVGHHGNTSAASVPLALDEAVRDGRIKSGHNVLLEGFGSGFSWGSVYFIF